MSVRVTRRRTMVAALIATVAVAAMPAGALAARGDGPYTPFPDGPDSRALDYVNKLNARAAGPGGIGAVTVTPQQLAEGVMTPAGEDASGGSGGAGGRGGRGSAKRSDDDGVGSAASPFKRAGFSPASPPPDPRVVPFLALGSLLGVAGVGVGVYRVRRRWAA